MKFVCPHCQARYSINQTKVRGKVLKIRCKRCSYILTVQGPRDASPLPQQEAPTPRRGGDASVPLFGDNQMSAAPDISRAPAPREDPQPEEQIRPCPALDLDHTPQPEQDQWYLAVDGNQFGPMDHDELCNRVRRGEAGGEAFVWQEGFDDWLDIAQVLDLPRQPPHPPPAAPDRCSLQALAVEAAEPSPVVEPPAATVAQEVEPPSPGLAERVGSPQAQHPRPRIPLLMKVTAAGGITAGLCGLFLVAYILYVEKPQAVVSSNVPECPLPRDVSPESPPPVKKQDRGEPSSGVPPLVVTPGKTRDRKVRPHGNKSRKRSARKSRRPHKKPGEISQPNIPPPRELPDQPRRGVEASPVDLSGQVQKLQSRYKKRLSTCYERAAKHDNSLDSLKAEFALDIGGSGLVRKVTIDAGGNTYLEGCLKKIVRRWFFTAGEAQTLRFSILFTGSGKGY